MVGGGPSCIIYKVTKNEFSTHVFVPVYLWFQGCVQRGKGGPAEGRKLDELSVRVYIHIAGPSNTEHCLSVQHLTIYLNVLGLLLYLRSVPSTYCQRIEKTDWCVLTVMDNCTAIHQVVHVPVICDLRPSHFCHKYIVLSSYITDLLFKQGRPIQQHCTA